VGEGVDELEERFNTDSEEALARAQAAIDIKRTESELRAYIAQARQALRSPETAVAIVNAEESHLEVASAPPPEADRTIDLRHMDWMWK
jgi:hypothetical protein